MFARRMAAIVAVLCLGASAAWGAVPPMISYQGKLMQPSGVPVPDGIYSIRFAIYDTPTAGNTLWSETNPSVQVKSGLFATMLGSVVNLPANIFDTQPRFFGIKVGSGSELIPRQQIASVAFAVKAGSADIAVTVPDASVTTNKVAPAAITTDRLAPAAVTADKLAPGVAVPPGTILMWSGATTAIPQGWVLCNGQNGTPDLRNRFLVGAGDEYAVAATGGEKLHKLSVAEMPSHNHTGAYLASDYASSSIIWGCQQGDPWLFHGIHLDPAGGDQPHENRPPYYALCFIMKLAY